MDSVMREGEGFELESATLARDMGFDDSLLHWWQQQELKECASGASYLNRA